MYSNVSFCSSLDNKDFITSSILIGYSNESDSLRTKLKFSLIMQHPVSGIHKTFEWATSIRCGVRVSS